MLVKLVLSLGVKLLTQKFLVSAFIHIAEYLVKKTDNDLDDKLVAEIKKALSAE